MTTTTTPTTITCIRCAGTGEFRWMTSQGWAQGTCFRCGGSGVDPRPVQAEKIIARTAEQRVRDEARVAQIETEKTEREAAQALRDELRWANEGVATIEKMIAEADDATANLLRTTALPLVEARLAKAIADDRGVGA